MKTASNTAVTADQTDGFPAMLQEAVRELVDEYEQRETIESQIVHDADKLELVLQSREYRAQGGYDTSDWLRSSLASLKTPIARKLAELACQVPPEHWWETVRDLHSRPTSDDQPD